MATTWKLNNIGSTFIELALNFPEETSLRLNKLFKRAETKTIRAIPNFSSHAHIAMGSLSNWFLIAKLPLENSVCLLQSAGVSLVKATSEVGMCVWRSLCGGVCLGVPRILQAS